MVADALIVVGVKTVDAVAEVETIGPDYLCMMVEAGFGVESRYCCYMRNSACAGCCFLTYHAAL